MIRNLPGGYNVGDTVYCYFPAYDSNRASVTITGLAVTDIEVYKDGSITQRASDNGYALLDTDGIDFDGSVGLHGFSVDTSDNSDAGFWADGHHYLIWVDAVTIDGQTVRFGFELRLGVLLRATTDGRKLDVSSGGAAGVDWANVESPTTEVGLSGTTVGTVTTLTNTVTLANGAHGGAAATLTLERFELSSSARSPLVVTSSAMAYPAVHLTATNQAPVMLFTIPGSYAGIYFFSEYGAACAVDGNAGLSAGQFKFTWNSDWDAEVQSEVDDALAAVNLDHLCKTATAGADMTTEVADNTILSRILANGDTSAFVPSTDGLQPIRDQGDAAWGTATGFSTHDAAAVAALILATPANKLTTDASGYVTYANTAPPTAAQNRAEMDSNSTQLAAIVADLPNRPTKGVAFNLVFMMLDSSDHVSPKTGLTVTVTVSKDGGAFANATNSASEISGGFYKVTLTAAEMDADVVAVSLTATGADTTGLTMPTQKT